MQASLENLAGIEDALRVERSLEGAHQSDLGRRAGMMQIRLFLEPDAMLGGYRTIQPGKRTVDDVLDRFPDLGVVRRGRNHEVQVAVAEVAEHIAAGGATTFRDTFADACDIRGHRIDR